MIKRTLTALLLLSGLFTVNIVNAQINQTANLSVVLNNTVTFVLSDVSPLLTFTDSDDYNNGVTYTAAAAGLVTANAPFSISVKSNSETLNATLGDESIDVGAISLQATGSNLGTTDKIALSTSEQDIIQGAPAGLAKTFGLTYSTAPGDEDFIGKAADAYTTTLVFTATLD